MSPTIISCSPHVFQKPEDAPHVHHTGYWVLEDGVWGPPEDLLAFMAKGAPLVYIGFGSVGNPDLAVQMTELVMKALNKEKTDRKKLAEAI